MTDFQTVVQQCKRTKAAFLKEQRKGEGVRNRALEALIAKLNDPNCRKTIYEANELDLEDAKARGRSLSFLDRLKLNDARVDQMIAGIKDVIAFKYPVGELSKKPKYVGKLVLHKQRVPIGVIAIIFEARPNVAVDAAALALKSGNGLILRGSSESARSVAVLADMIRASLEAVGMNADLVGNVEADRETTAMMLGLDEYIDVVIPRGGEALKHAVKEHAKMQVLASAGGNCHLYVTVSAPLDKAVKVIVNAKCQRPGVCNALETLLFDAKLSHSYVETILKALRKNHVKLVLDPGLAEEFPKFVDELADDDDFYKEYEALLIKAKRVNGLEAAIAHINQYGTHHSDGILTGVDREWHIFRQNVDSAVVYLNTSTRFTDGYEFGLGAEMGISTGKLHVRGPIGINELTTYHYVVTSDYAERE